MSGAIFLYSLSTIAYGKLIPVIILLQMPLRYVAIATSAIRI
jgi:hypothetical protein